MAWLVGVGSLCVQTRLPVLCLLLITDNSQILEGLATIIASGIAVWVLPEGLATAPFFTEEERAFASNPISRPKCFIILILLVRSQTFSNG